jgi:beta-lactamase regulating signal transducer with metallopeptidase domain/uncharacterized GH25 family protein
MNAWLTAFGGWQPLVDAPVWVLMLLKISAILAAAWLAHLAIARTNPRWRVVLWRVTAVGLLVLPAIAWLLPGLEIRVLKPTPVEEVATVSPAPKAMLDARTMTSRIPSDYPGNLPDTRAPNFLPKSGSRPPKTLVPSMETRSASPPAESPAPEPPQSGDIAWSTLLLATWLGGIVVLGIRLCLGHYWISATTRGAKQVPPWVRCECTRVAEATGCRRRVEVVQSPEVESPFLCGLRRPLLLLPAQMCEASYCKDLPGILAHELAHVRSHDVSWNAALQAISIALWFHPLIWRVRKAHLAACELVSDAVSASFVGDVTGYCRTLARVAVDVCGSLPSAGIAMARTSAIGRRLSALKKRVFHLPLRRRSVLVFGFAVLLGVAIIGTLQVALAAPPEEESSAADKTEPKPAKTETKPTKAAEAAIKPGFRPLKVHAFDAAGKPLAEAGVTVQGRTETPFGPFRYETDGNGTVLIDASKEATKYYQVLVSKSGFVSEGASWNDYRNMQIPDELTFNLKPGTALGGFVRDEQGKPISGAEVIVQGGKTSHTEAHWTSVYDTVATDAEGKWQVHRIPKDLTGCKLYVTLKHPDFGFERFDVQQLPLDKLRDQTAALVMRKGVIVEGTVTTPDGKPAAGVAVGLFVTKYPSMTSARTKTDDKGRYRVVLNEPGGYTVAAAAEAFVPGWKEITVGKEQRTVDLQLGKGELIRLRVVDHDGKPMPGIPISFSIGGLDKHMGLLFLDYESSLKTNNPAYHKPTDAEGRWSRLWIPNAKISFSIKKEGYLTVEKPLAPDEREQIITLETGQWSVSGRVVDQETKAPIQKFHVMVGNTAHWDYCRPIADEKGEYRLTWDRAHEDRVIGIEADGYYPSKPQFLGSKEKQATWNIELKKGNNITGVVRSPDGKSLANVDVVLCTPRRCFYFDNGRLRMDNSSLVVRTGADGRFSFPPQNDPFLLVAVHDRGFAQVADKAAMKEIALQPWARLEGTVTVDGKPGVQEGVEIIYDRVWEKPPATRSPAEQASQMIFRDFRIQTDANGHFVFDRVQPGKAEIGRTVSVSPKDGISKDTQFKRKSVEFVPGKTLVVNIADNAPPTPKLNEDTTKKPLELKPAKKTATALIPGS